MGLDRTTLLVGLLLVLGCHESGSAGPDARLAPDGPPNAAGCGPQVEGDAPFGVLVAGDAHLTTQDGESMDRTISFGVYFPQGRRAGASVVLARYVQWPEPEVRTSTAQLDEQRAATVTWAGKLGMEDLSVTSTLFGPSAGLEAEVHVNVADPGTDVARRATGTVLLCPVAEEVPAPALHAGGPFGPISGLSLLPSVPIDVASATATATAGGVPVEVTTSSRGGSLGVSPAAAFPPGSAVSLDVTGTLDILGRPFAMTLDLQPLVTTASRTNKRDFGRPRERPHPWQAAGAPWQAGRSAWEYTVET